MESRSSLLREEVETSALAMPTSVRLPLRETEKAVWKKFSSRRLQDTSGMLGTSVRAEDMKEHSEDQIMRGVLIPRRKCQISR